MPRPIEWRFTASLVAEVLAWIALATIIVILVSTLNASPARSGSLENRRPALLGQPRAVRRLEAHDARALALVDVRDQRGVADRPEDRGGHGACRNQSTGSHLVNRYRLRASNRGPQYPAASVYAR